MIVHAALWRGIGTPLLLRRLPTCQPGCMAMQIWMSSHSFTSAQVCSSPMHSCNKQLLCRPALLSTAAQVSASLYSCRICNHFIMNCIQFGSFRQEDSNACCQYECAFVYRLLLHRNTAQHSTAYAPVAISQSLSHSHACSNAICAMTGNLLHPQHLLSSAECQ